MIGKALDWLCNGLRVLLAALMISLAIPVAMGIIARYTPLLPNNLWTVELATFLFIWIVMIGSMVAVWDGTHFDVRITPDAKRPIFVLLQNGFVLVLILGFALIFAWYGIAYAEFGFKQNSPMMRANLLITHISVPIAGVVWTLFASYRLFEVIDTYRRSRRGVAQ